MEENNTQGVQTPGTQTAEPVVDKTQDIDYASEYKKLLVEVEKNKKLKDDYAKENAEYKRKEREKMSESEKTAQEYKELVESKKALETELASLKFQATLSKSGYSAEEISKIVESNGSPEVYAEIMSERAKALEKALKAEAVKTTTPSTPIGNNLSNGKEKSEFALFQEKKATNKISNKIEF